MSNRLSKAVQKRARRIKERLLTVQEGAPLAYPIGNDRVGFDDPAGGVLETDEKVCSVRFRFSTPNQDRDGDVILMEGINLDDFRRNPVVFWSHQQHPFPIGTAEDPTTKQLACAITPEAFDATVFFDTHDDFALFVFDKVARGIIRATSIGFLPLDAQRLKPSKQGVQHPGWLFRKILLTELTVCGVGANQDALRLALDREPVSDVIKKCFSPYAATCKGLVNGWSPKSGRDLILPAAPADPLRWNKSLSAHFDRPVVQSQEGAALDNSNTEITKQHKKAGFSKSVLDNSNAGFDPNDQYAMPATAELAWVSAFIGCEVKELYGSRTSVPSPRMGSFLVGLKHALHGSELIDTRNLTRDGRETPPVYEKIQLNSTQSDSFLIDGASFYRGQFDKFVLRYEPNWSGLELGLYTRREFQEAGDAILTKAWAWAKANNFLKNEAFALSGEFLPRTEETWADIFIEKVNQEPIERTLKAFNDKGKAFPSRGSIYAGPAGTGKTLSGRIIRNEAKGTFIWMAARDFYHAGGFGGIDFGFELAKELAPAVLFIEDVDNWLGDTTIDLMKSQMDGIGRHTGVWTILTTNFPERLPAALIDRPGRFHDVLRFDVPTPAARKAMLQKWLPLLSQADLDAAVQSMDGYSGAHVYELAHFAKTLEEQDGLDRSHALRQALMKVQEQRALIDELQLRGSNYRPGRKMLEKTLPLAAETLEISNAVQPVDKPTSEEKLFAALFGKAVDASGHEHAADGKFGSGGSSGNSPTAASEAGETHAELHERAMGVLAQLGAELKAKGVETIKGYIDKVPGGQYLREKVTALKAGMEERYGKKTAGNIFAAANVISWGAFVAGPIVGHPNYIPASGLMLAGAALAEGYLQLKSGLGALGVGKALDEELTEEQVQAEGQKLADAVQEAVREWLKEHPEETAEEKLIGRLVEKVKDDSGHEHAADSGQFTSGGGGGSAGSGKQKPRTGDDVSEGYVDAFNENPETATEEELETANREMDDDGSECQLVFNETHGHFEALTAEEREDEYGSEDAYSRKNPETGKWETAEPAYFNEADAAADKAKDDHPDDDDPVHHYLDAFREDGGTEEELATANREIAEEGSDWRIELDESEGEYVAVRSQKKHCKARPTWFPKRKQSADVRFIKAMGTVSDTSGGTLVGHPDNKEVFQGNDIQCVYANRVNFSTKEEAVAAIQAALSFDLTLASPAVHDGRWAFEQFPASELTEGSAREEQLAPGISAVIGQRRVENPTVDALKGKKCLCPQCKSTPVHKDLSECVQKKIPLLIKEGYERLNAIATAFNLSHRDKTFHVVKTETAGGDLVVYLQAS